MIDDGAMLTRPNIASREKGLEYLGTFQAGKEEKERCLQDEDLEMLSYKPKNGGAGYFGAGREIEFTYRGKKDTTRAIVILQKEEKRGRRG